MKIAKNIFRDGLVMDLAPDNTQNTCLTNALNATITTNNGNEFSLQNDMGNTKVETAKLPSGYIPVGSTELGGIIYIASYNPLTKKCQLGSFPSPERNISSEESSLNDIYVIQDTDFFNTEFTAIENYIKEVPLNLHVNTGDKFVVYSSDAKPGNYTVLLAVKDVNGQLVYLTNETITYDVKESTEININNLSYQVATKSGDLYLVGKLKSVKNWDIEYEITNSDNGTFLIFNPKNLPGDMVDSLHFNINGTTISKEITNPGIFISFPIINNKIIFKEENLEIELYSDLIINISPEVIYLNGVNKERIPDFNATITKYLPFSKLGTGNHEINVWKYKHHDTYLEFKTDISLNPLPNTIINQIKYEFREYDSTLPLFTITKFEVDLYNNAYTDNINYDTEYNNKHYNGKLEKNKIYLVTVKVDDKTISEAKHLIFTSPIFNGFYDNSSYYMLSEKDDEIIVTQYNNYLQDFSSINYTYGYKEKETIVYPLQLTVLNKITNFDLTGVTINSQISGKLISESEISDNEIKNTFNIVGTSDITQQTVFKENWNIFSVENLENTNSPKYFITNGNKKEEVEIDNNLNLTITLIDKATFSNSTKNYNCGIFRPLVYNTKTLNQYGMKFDGGLLTTAYNRFPVWSFWSEEGDNDKDFDSFTVQFKESNWKEVNDVANRETCDNERYRQLNMYNDNDVQTSIKSLLDYCNIHSPIIPHMFGYYAGNSTNKDIDIYNLNGINENNILAKYIVSGGTSLPFLENSGESSFVVEKDSNYLKFASNLWPIIKETDEGNGNLYGLSPRILSFIMLDEDDKVRPLNCFTYYRPNHQQACISTIISEETSLDYKEYPQLMLPVFNLLNSIYKQINIENVSLYTATNILYEDLNTNLTVTITNNTEGKLGITPIANTNIPNLNYATTIEKTSTTSIDLSQYINKDELRDYIQKTLSNTQVNKIITNDSDKNTQLIFTPNLESSSLYYLVLNNGAHDLHILDGSFMLTYNPSIKIESVDQNKISITNSDSTNNVTIKKLLKILPIQLNAINPSLSIYDTSKDDSIGDDITITKITIDGIKKDLESFYITVTSNETNETNETNEILLSGTDFSNTYTINKVLKYLTKIDFIPFIKINDKLPIIKDDNSVVISPENATVNISIKIEYYLNNTNNEGDIIYTKGIGDYLTLNGKGLLCLKSDIWGGDGYVKIYSGKSDAYKTRWEFNTNLKLLDTLAV